jgi:hypothetical protein
VDVVGDPLFEQKTLNCVGPILFDEAQIVFDFQYQSRSETDFVSDIVRNGFSPVILAKGSALSINAGMTVTGKARFTPPVYFLELGLGIILSTYTQAINVVNRQMGNLREQIETYGSQE